MAARGLVNGRSPLRRSGRDLVFRCYPPELLSPHKKTEADLLGQPRFDLSLPVSFSKPVLPETDLLNDFFFQIREPFLHLGENVPDIRSLMAVAFVCIHLVKGNQNSGILHILQLIVGCGAEHLHCR